MEKNRKRIVLLLTVALAIGLAAAIAADARRRTPEATYVNAFAMGSTLTAEIYGGAETTAETLEQAVHTLDGRISRTVNDSLITAINTRSVCETDAAFVDTLQRLCAISDASGGAFDVTVGALADLWNVGAAEPRVPTDAEIAEALARTGYQKIRVAGTTVSVPDGMRLDLGAAGKGMACDEARRVLAADSAVTGAVVASGGSVLLYGAHPKKGYWTVGVRDPDGADTDIMGTIRTDACCVSTSGNYEKYFVLDGKRYCHILSPYDGRPADSGLKSVTVRTQSGMESDALSTACFVLGVEKSLPLLAARGADAVFITDENRVIVTDGLKDAFQLTKDAYAIEE